MGVHGVLVVDKPTGMTSARVVSKVKRALGAKRVGHTGTLDPMATGVLPIVVGEGTKIAGYLLADDKAYEGEFELGVETDTLDREGQVTGGDVVRAKTVSDTELRAAMESLTGVIEQVPPMFSALKKDGRRLYQLARAGQTVERAPRTLKIGAFELTGVSGRRVRFSVECSKGTYVRALARDLGIALGCGAHLTALRRTRSGPFDLSRAVTLDELTPELAGARIVPPHLALVGVPSVVLPDDRVVQVGQGAKLQWKDVAGSPPPEGPIALIAKGRGLVALVESQGGRIEYRRVFGYALTATLNSSIVPPANRPT